MIQCAGTLDLFSFLGKKGLTISGIFFLCTFFVAFNVLGRTLVMHEHVIFLSIFSFMYKEKMNQLQSSMDFQAFWVN